ncbi:MAG TPA: glycerol-3-phosphate 1-O-acyltransferase PlsY [Ktedonobacterales bacterium]|jgi:glycerol-3-phosphate acyltransferase PlsY|nr:glycerol-3-phosphate 1-O-acyltransferase PlsY [Ktedonobacterales bacterium]
MSSTEIILRFIGAIIVGYLLGSTPTGVVVSRIFGGTDPRKVGSGKTGATNIMRSLGPGPAAIVVVVDLLKGVAAVLLARFVFVGGAAPAGYSAQTWSTLRDSAEAAAAMAAVLGHNYSIYLRFKGGRGVLTATGAMTTMSPITTIFAAFAGIPSVFLTRYVSLGSVMGSLMSIVAEIYLTITHVDSVPHCVFIVVAASLVIVSHKDNIERLRAGNERKLGEKAQPITQPK